MTPRLISAFQPVGDAASELREIVPGLGHGDAVIALRAAEANGRAILADGTQVVFRDHDGGWTVTTNDSD